MNCSPLMPNAVSCCETEGFWRMSGASGRSETLLKSLHLLHFPLVMAWRETRAAIGKFLFVVLSVALGTAALTAVAGFNESVRYTLMREARSLMAADISLRMPFEPTPEELKFIETLTSKGIESSSVTETVRMASTGEAT